MNIPLLILMLIVLLNTAFWAFWYYFIYEKPIDEPKFIPAGTVMCQLPNGKIVPYQESAESVRMFGILLNDITPPAQEASTALSSFGQTIDVAVDWSKVNTKENKIK
jgi:hypothetical protein